MIKKNLFSKIITIIILLWKNKKNIILKSPPIKKVLLADDSTVSILKKTVLYNLDFLEVSTRPQLKKIDKNNIEGKYFISIKIIIYFIIGLTKKLNFKSSYVFSCIKCSNPQLVLNNSHDWNLLKIADLFPNINFILLCHGNWFDFTNEGKKLYDEFQITWLPHEMSKIKLKNPLNNFYVLMRGKKDIDLFKNIGVNNVNYLGVGSYEASYYRSLKLSDKKKYDILFVSQLVNTVFNNPTKFCKLYKILTLEALSLLSKYAQKKKLSIAYLCRGTYENNIQEISFATKILSNCNFKIIENKKNPLWETIYTSDIVTTLDSTVGHDSIFIEKKTMLIPMSLNNKYLYATKPDKKINELWDWTITDSDYVNFERKMDDLVNIDYEKYKRKISNYLNYNFYNKKENSHEIVNEFIKNLI